MVNKIYQFDYFIGGILLGILYLMTPLPQRKAFCYHCGIALFFSYLEANIDSLWILGCLSLP